MRISSTTAIALIVCCSAATDGAQVSTNQTPVKSAPTTQGANNATAAPAATPPPTPALVGPSTVLRPSLDAVQQALNSVRTDRWKRGTVRDEAGADIESVLNDIQLNLPPLLRDADAAPGTLSKSIPVARNVDALYDVLLRVVEASRLAAPDEQANALRQALNTLNSGRLALYDKMLDAAAAQEKQVADLRVTVQKQAAFKCPAPPPEKPCPPPPAPKKPRRRVTPKPATPNSTNPQATPNGNTNATPSKPGM